MNQHAPHVGVGAHGVRLRYVPGIGMAHKPPRKEAEPEEPKPELSIPEAVLLVIGEGWVRNETLPQLVPLTQTQITGGLSRLRRDGLIETEILYGAFKGKHSKHRLTEAGKAAQAALGGPK